MEQLLKIPVSHSWKIPSLKCPIYSSFVSGSLFMLRHFALFTVISKSISFDVESIYHSVHIPVSLFPHFSHFGILRSSSECLFFFPFKLYFGALKDPESCCFKISITAIFLWVLIRPRAYQRWLRKAEDWNLRIRLIIRPTALWHKSESEWFIEKYQLDSI